MPFEKFPHVHSFITISMNFMTLTALYQKSCKIVLLFINKLFITALQLPAK
jgi:hypothetical protein